MKVYLVHYYCYDTSWIEDVYANREDAQKRADELFKEHFTNEAPHSSKGVNVHEYEVISEFVHNDEES